MDFQYTPHRQAGGILHLPSPTHNPHIDGLATQTSKIRRSLSKSPSKPARFAYAQTPAGSPGSPHSPLALYPVLSPKLHTPGNFFALQTTCKMPEPSSTPKKKFSVRRLVPAKSTRSAISTRSPIRKVLSDSSNKGNATPSLSRRSSGEENSIDESDSSGSRPSSTSHPHFRFDLSEGPIKFGAPRSRADPIFDSESSKSTPLKRSDGEMDLGQADFGTPVKRRSLHAGMLGVDVDIFQHQQSSSPLNFTTSFPASEPTRPVPETSNDTIQFTSFSSPVIKRPGPSRKSLNRQSQFFPRSRGILDASTQSSPTTKARNRLSLDVSHLLSLSSTSKHLLPFTSNSTGPPVNTGTSHIQNRSATVTNQPHPLSKTLVPSSSGSSLTEETTKMPVEVQRIPYQIEKSHFQPIFSKSLPIGAIRPDGSQTGSSGSFATPAAIKSLKPQPGGFMSTGLISKRNRHPEFHPYNDTDRYNMPDTPSKRASFPPVTATPFPKITTEAHTPFGDPETPLITHTSKAGFDLFGKPIHHGGLFGASIARRTSFVSDDGDDQAPSTHDSQSSADELPPTPTKLTGSGRIKSNSLRSSLFGRRTSLNPETFSPAPTQAVESMPPRLVRKVTPIPDHSANSSPITPQSNFDTSQGSMSLSIFKASTAVIVPMTPTAQRDNAFSFQPAGAPNDVDTSIKARFANDSVIAQGEFSMVYKVENPLQYSFLHGVSPPSPGSSWIVKKMKKPYIGLRDRNNKYREVEILRILKGRDHVLEFIDSWEHDNRLYIQTENCENGSLASFLASAGNKARLDDFRVWKILLELALGVQAIHDADIVHLDLKPANIFITFEGTLKIGDFGLASRWPVPKGLEGEGDREYIAPEVLLGQLNKSADVFAIGLITLEIAGNFFLPDNGEQWQRLRSGNLKDVPSLTWSTDSRLDRDENGDPVDVEDDQTEAFNQSTTNLLSHISRRQSQRHELEHPPSFMHDPAHAHSLDNLVTCMLEPDPDARPTIRQVGCAEGLSWVAQRRRAGATIFEGNWGPAWDGAMVDSRKEDVEMEDV